MTTIKSLSYNKLSIALSLPIFAWFAYLSTNQLNHHVIWFIQHMIQWEMDQVHYRILGLILWGVLAPYFLVITVKNARRLILGTCITFDEKTVEFHVPGFFKHHQRIKLEPGKFEVDYWNLFPRLNKSLFLFGAFGLILIRRNSGERPIVALTAYYISEAKQVLECLRALAGDQRGKGA